MVVRKMTDKEAEQIFGNGLVLFGQRRPQPSSANSQASPQTQQDSVDSASSGLPDLQNLPVDPALAPMEQLNQEPSQASTMENEPDSRS